VRARLRELANLALEQLGVREPKMFVEDEMVTQYTLLAHAIPKGPDHDRRLLSAIERAIEEHVGR
jgi:hypothetical protein